MQANSSTYVQSASKFGFISVFLALGMLLGACSTTPVSQTPVSFADASDEPLPEWAHEVTIYAISLVGTPYRYGGNTPEAGFDCSGLIGYVYQTRGAMSLPRTVARLQDVGKPVGAQSLRSGDLVVFGRQGNATHAGIYVGEGRFVHAPSTGGEVRLDRLNSRYWSNQQVVYRRL
jgi:cell wall-associated NlpC family hydrolase